MSDKQEQIKRIAEGMGFETRQGIEMVVIALGVSEWHEEVWEEFDPFENDGHAFKVLEALVKRASLELCGQILLRDLATFDDPKYFVAARKTGGSFVESVESDFKSTICEAYLSLIQPVEGE